MTRLTFWLGLILVALLALAALVETGLERSLDQAEHTQQELQARLARAREVDRFCSLLVRRTGTAAETDSAIAQLLKKHGIDLIVTTRENLPQEVRKEAARQQLNLTGTNAGTGMSPTSTSSP